VSGADPVEMITPVTSTRETVTSAWIFRITMIRYYYPRLNMGIMVRAPLTEQERARGLALGRALQKARGTRSAAEVAAAAGVALDTLRKIERGAIATPAFFTVTALADVLGIDLRELSTQLSNTFPVTA
jgi:hypothetical protein